MMNIILLAAYSFLFSIIGPGRYGFERPQIMRIDKKPDYLYAPSGYHFFSGNSTASYVLEFEED